MGKYFTEKERYMLEAYLDAKLTVIEIAEKLHKTRQTIYNEIKRGTVKQIDTHLKEYYVYKADYAQSQYDEKKQYKGKGMKIGNDMEFVKFFENMYINKKYSPFAILQHIKHNKLTFKTNVCQRTLYNYIYKGVFLNVPGKQKREKHPRKVSLNNKNANLIENRDKDIDERKDFGHWEMDTVVSGKGKGLSTLLVLTERKARFELVFKMPDKKCESTVNVINLLESKLGLDNFRKYFKTITCDNGVEFLDTTSLQTSSTASDRERTIIYYCHPYSSWERGSNENANKFIRKFYPKGYNFDDITQEEIIYLNTYINNYPRKILRGYTSYHYTKYLAPDFINLIEKII